MQWEWPVYRITVEEGKIVKHDIPDSPESFI